MSAGPHPTHDSAQEKHVIHFDDVTLTYPDGTDRVVAVDQADLTVESGTVIGITGPSGSGKSSLLALGSLLVPPDSGRVLIDGVDTTGMDQGQTAALRRDKIGIVFQQPRLLPSLTAREQLVVMGELAGPTSRRERAERTEKADGLLTEVGLDGLGARTTSQLSGGQQQRVNIARSLMNDPSVLLVDEPTSALDRRRGAEIIDLLVQLTHERGTATVLVTHELEHLKHLDGTRWMVDGKLGTQAPEWAAA